MSSSVSGIENSENKAINLPKPSPWAKTTAPKVVCSLEDVMSEQLANELQKKENSNFLLDSKSTKLPENLEDFEAASMLIESKNCDSDYMLAQLLQLEMDKEYDESLKRHEHFKNKNSLGIFLKIKIEQ